MGVVHDLPHLAQDVVELPVQVKQLHIQLGHIHHLARPFPGCPGGLIGGVRGPRRSVPDPIQQFLHLVVHRARSFLICPYSLRVDGRSAPYPVPSGGPVFPVGRRTGQGMQILVSIVYTNSG